MRISRCTRKRMENLKGFCDFDAEKRVASVRAHYSSADEITDPELSRPGCPVVTQEALSYLQSLSDTIPAEFRVRICVVIDDYGKYDRQLMTEAYRAGLESMEYVEKIEKKRMTVLMAVFVPAGFIFLLAALLADKNQWFIFCGPAVSIIIVVMIEFMFEVFFEESAVFFSVTHIYEHVLALHQKRLLGIELS